MSIFIYPDGTIKVDTVAEALDYQEAIQSKLDGIAKASDYKIEDPAPTATNGQQPGLFDFEVQPKKRTPRKKKVAIKAATKDTEVDNTPAILKGKPALLATWAWMSKSPNRTFSPVAVSKHFHLGSITVAHQRLYALHKMGLAERTTRGRYKAV